MLYAGSLDQRQKNLTNLLIALRTLMERQPIEAVLCGEGPDRQAVEKFVAQSRLASRIQPESDSTSESRRTAASAFTSALSNSFS